MSARGEYAKSAATRCRILTAARRLLAERPAAQVSLRSIAAAAGLSQAGLLHHYPSKAALLAAVVMTPDSTRDSWLDEHLHNDPRGEAHREKLEAWVRLSRSAIALDVSTRSALITAYRDAHDALSDDGLDPRELLSTLLGLQLLAEIEDPQERAD